MLSSLPKPLAALFDMDGVLVDSNPYHKLAFERFLHTHQLTLTEQQLRTHVYGRTNQEIMPYLFPDAFTPQRGEQWAEEKEALFRALYAEALTPVAGLVPFLDALQQAGVKLAVGTSAPQRNLDFIVDRLQIRAYFDALLHAADVRRGKPDPEIYLNAAARLGAAPAACVVFEDSLAGLQAGLRAGMKVIALTTTHTPAELHAAHLVIPDFTALSVAAVVQLVHAGEQAY